MAQVEFERKLRISRKEAGERLIALGQSLLAGAKSKLEHEGDSIQFTVADQIDWEFELEIDGDDIELEIELKWSNRKPAPRAARAAAPSTGATPAAAKRRAANKRSTGAPTP